MRDVAVVGVGQTRHGVRNDVRYSGLVYEAVKDCLKNTGVGIEEIDAIVNGSMPSLMEGLNASHFWLADAQGAWSKPMMRIATCGTTGMSVAQSTYYHVASGIYDVAMAIGMEKMHENDPQGTMMTVAEPYYQRKYVAGAPGVFAEQCNAYVHRYKVSKEKLREAAAEISVVHHRNALDNPYAHLKMDIDVDDVLKSPMVSYPVRLLDLCPSSDGACAVIFASEEKAKEITDIPAWVEGLSYSGDEHFLGDKDMVKWKSAIKAARGAYKMAGIEEPAKELDVAEIYNPFTYQEMIFYECFGFCGWGEAYKLVEDGSIKRDGEIPCDPSGGVLATNPIGASGLLRVGEAALQIMGKAEAHQIENVGKALSHAMGGTNQFNGVMILGRR